jgi:arginyl-tRNA synthetase
LRTDDLLRGKRFFVDYGDPNATKALHVGHLRCVAMGHGVTSMLKAAGGQVTTLSLVNDIGRNMCEAMAGHVEFFPHDTPESTGLKSDHFVGQCYSTYVSSLQGPDAHEGTLDAPLGRELEDRADLAQSLLNRWSAGDREARELWTKVRRWVLDGQDATVRRLGALQDRMLYESTSLERAAQMVEVGLEKGIFHRTPTGVVYNTGLSEYQHMPLVRHDGFPTENLRLAAVFYDIQEEGRDLAACVHIMGDEWVQLIACRERMLPHFIECPLYAAYHKLGCAMVTFHGSKMKSSSGEVLLIDELIDRTAALDGVVKLSDGAGPTPEELARIIILAFYLARKPSKTIEFSWENFIDPAVNIGWKLAAAWSRACSSTQNGECDPDPQDAAYRYAILRSQCFRRSATQSASSYDVLPTMTFLGHLSSWYVDIEPHDRTNRVMRTVLRAGLASLGLIDRS